MDAEKPGELQAQRQDFEKMCVSCICVDDYYYCLQLCYIRDTGAA